MAAQGHYSATVDGRAAAGPDLQRRALCRPNRPTCYGTLTLGRQRAAGRRRDAALRSGRRRLTPFSFIGYNGLMAGAAANRRLAVGRPPEISSRLWTVQFRRNVQVRRWPRRLFPRLRHLDRPHLYGPKGRTIRPYGFDLGGAYAASPPTSFSSTTNPGDQRRRAAAGARPVPTEPSIDDRQHQYEPDQRRQSDRNQQHRLWHRHR